VEISPEVLLRELIRRGHAKAGGASSLTDPLFPEQSGFVTEASRYLSAICTRRAGKTSGLALRYFNAARRHQGAILPYFALTRDSARNIMWPVLREMATKHQVQAEFKDSSLRCQVGTSEIVLMGADMPNFIGRVRGIKTPFAAIDEAQKFRNSILTELIDDILTPAIADYADGALAVCGTPGPLPKGKFYDITNGKEGYAIHRWSVFQNPYMPGIREFVEDMKRKKEWTDSHPTYRREWLGEWVADIDALVYKWDEAKNWATSLPTGELRYVLGVDLGYDPDPSAFVLCAYSPHDPTLYVIETFKQTKMIVSDVAERIRHYLKDHPLCQVVIDLGAQGKQIGEEIRQRFAIPILAADKTGKSGFIEIMNSDLSQAHVKVVRGKGQDLVDEWSQLIWDPDSARREEHPEYDNHLTDAALYAWRWAYNYAWTNKPKKIDPSSEAAVDAWMEREAAKVERQRNRMPWDMDDDEDLL